MSIRENRTNLYHLLNDARQDLLLSCLRVEIEMAGLCGETKQLLTMNLLGIHTKIIHRRVMNKRDGLSVPFIIVLEMHGDGTHGISDSDQQSRHQVQGQKFKPHLDETVPLGIYGLRACRKLYDD